MAVSRASLVLSFALLSLLSSLPLPTNACYSTFKFMPAKYDSCLDLKGESSIAWSLRFNNAIDPTRKYLSGMYVTAPTQIGWWGSYGLNLIDQGDMLEAAAMVCHNTARGPKVFQVWMEGEELGLVAVDKTKDHLNVTSLSCSVESLYSDGRMVGERIYIKFSITLGAKAKYFQIWARGPTSSTNKTVVAGTIMQPHEIVGLDKNRYHDYFFHDFRNMTPGGVQPGPYPSSPPPKAKSPPPKAKSPPPKAKSPPPKRQSPPPKAKSPPPKAKSPPPKAKSPPRKS